MSRRTWQLQEAKARLSELVREAQERGPQEITVRGSAAVVVISKDDFTRMTGGRPSFTKFMRQSPLAGVDLNIERDRSPGRDIDL